MKNNRLYPVPTAVKNWQLSTLVPRWLMNTLKEKRLIFTLTTGRSGTAFLATLLGVFPEVVALHEPEPKFSHWMRKVQSKREIAWYFWVLHKFPYIARQKSPIYVETSHLFGKGFVEPLLHLQVSFDLIILKRHRRDVAKSLFQLNTIPARSQDGERFLVSPLDPVLVPLPAPEMMNDYQLCYWYTLEMEARAEYYAQLVTQQGGRVVNVSFNDLLKVEGVLLLAEQLNLPQLSEQHLKNLNKKQNQPVNTKKSMKGRPLNFSEEELQQLEEEVLQLTGFKEEVPHA